MTAQRQQVPFKKTRTFKVLVLCVYVYSCAQLDPFKTPITIQIGNNVHAEEVQLEEKLKEKLKEKITKLILAVLD